MTKTVNQYIASFPKEVQNAMEEVRAVIKKEAPEAEEKMSYGIAAYMFRKKPLVYFGGFKNHLGFYPAPVGIEAFQKEFSIYKSGKGSVQFPLDKPMPLDLIARIVKFRLNEIMEQTEKKKQEFPDFLSAPARRALENHGITSLQKLSKLSEKELLQFHGMGKSSIPKLKEALAEKGLSFKGD